MLYTEVQVHECSCQDANLGLRSGVEYRHHDLPRLHNHGVMIGLMFLLVFGEGFRKPLFATARKDPLRQQTLLQSPLEQEIIKLRATVRHEPRSAEAYNKLGIALGKAGNLQESIKEFETAIQLKKRYARAYYNLGIAWIKVAQDARAKGKHDYATYLGKAFSAFNTAREIQPSLPNIDNVLGWLYEELGDVPSAIQEFHRAIRQQPNSAEAYTNLGKALSRQRDYVKAASAYEKATEINPHLVRAEIYLESVVLKAWGRETVLARRRKFVQSHPTSAVAHALWGHALLFNDHLSQAELELRKSVEVDPRLAIGWFYLGEVLQRRDNLGAASHCLDKAVELSPQTPQFLIKEGILLLRTGKVRAAIAGLSRAVTLDPDDVSPHYALATAFQKAGKRAEAVQQFRIATKLNNVERAKRNAVFLTSVGIEDLRAGKIRAAVQNLKQAVASDPNYAEANCYLGLGLAQEGNYTESIEAFQRALVGRPQSAKIHYNFGIALWQMGKPTEAIQEFRRAVSLNPDHRLARCALGKALMRQGDDAEGRSVLNKAQNLGGCPKGRWR